MTVNLNPDNPAAVDFIINEMELDDIFQPENNYIYMRDELDMEIFIYS